MAFAGQGGENRNIQADWQTPAGGPKVLHHVSFGVSDIAR